MKMVHDQMNVCYPMHLKKRDNHNVTICQHHTIRPSEAANMIMMEQDLQSLPERQRSVVRDGERSP